MPSLAGLGEVSRIHHGQIDRLDNGMVSGTARDRLELARCVLRPGERVRFVNHDNSAGSWVDLEKAVCSGRAYMGTVHSAVLALDCDPTEDLRASSGLKVMQTTLKNLGVAHVVCASGRPDHHHLFAKPQDTKIRGDLAALALSHGLGVRQMIRMPLSPHRHGLPVGLVHPSSTQEALRGLTGPSQQPLSPHCQRILDTGVSKHRSDSERLLSLCLAMYQRHWLKEEAFQALLDRPGGECLHRYRRQGRDAAYEFDQCWQKAVDYVREHPAVQGPPELVAGLVCLRDHMDAHTWEGSQGLTDRTVLLALMHIAITTSQITVHASERLLVEMTGRNSRTAIRDALIRLQKRGWLQRTSTGDRQWASTFTLPMHHCDNNDPLTTTLDQGGVRLSGTFLTHDVFASRRGLGSAAAWIYESLDVTGLKTTEIAERTGIGLRSVQRALQRLSDAGVARGDSHGWVLGRTSLDIAAERQGTVGAGDSLARRHATERTVNRGYETSASGGLVFTMRDSRPARRCQGRARSGQPCKRMSPAGEGFCRHHGPLP